MNAQELADKYTLEELREAFDTVDTATLFIFPHDDFTVRIGEDIVTTTPHVLGEAKLVKRGWKTTRPARRTRRRS